MDTGKPRDPIIPEEIRFGRAICGDLAEAERRIQEIEEQIGCD